LKEKCVGRFKDRETRIFDSRRFLVDLRKEFGRENNKTMKVVELKKVK